MFLIYKIVTFIWRLMNTKLGYCTWCGKKNEMHRRAQRFVWCEECHNKWGWVMDHKDLKISLFGGIGHK